MTETTTAPPKDKQVPKDAVHVIELDDDRKIYLNKPNRVTIEAALSHLSSLTGGANTIKAGEIIINSCRVGGVSPKELEQENPELFCSACVQACSILDLEQAKLKKL